MSMSSPDPSPPPPVSPPPVAMYTTPLPPVTSRPAALLLGGIGMGVQAVLYLATGVVTLLRLELWYTDRLIESTGLSTWDFLNVGFSVAMTAASLIAAILALKGVDLGRALALAVCGATIWEASGWGRELFVSAFDSDGLSLDFFPWIRGGIAIVAGLVALATLIALCLPSVGGYLASRREPVMPAGGPTPVPPSNSAASF